MPLLVELLIFFGTLRASTTLAPDACLRQSCFPALLLQSVCRPGLFPPPATMLVDVALSLSRRRVTEQASEPRAVLFAELLVDIR